MLQVDLTGRLHKLVYLYKSQLKQKCKWLIVYIIAFRLGFNYFRTATGIIIQ